MVRHLGTLSCLIIALTAAAPVSAAPPSAEPSASILRDADLRTIAESFAPAHSLRAIVEQGIDVVLRTKRERDPEWQELERKFPGLTKVTLDATRDAALSGVPGLTATLQEDAASFFASNLTVAERARFAAYLRRPYPQRSAHIPVEVRPGEKVLEALQRASKAIEAGATAAERREEALFHTSPLGRKCQALTETLLKQSTPRQSEIILPLIKSAMAKGDTAGIAFIGAQSPH
ncbi:MAG TPA: hypothetical protein VGC56_04315 [Allosphingosinicella sp.]|jgi:hypothetical protein